MRAIYMGSESSGSQSKDVAISLPENARIEAGLEIGKSYVVYAMHCLEGEQLKIEVDLTMPLGAASALFRIIDSRISRYWVFGQEVRPRFGTRTNVTLFGWGYPAYVESNDHRLGLLDGRSEDIELYERYRAAMELEFPDPAISLRAIALEGDWIQCEACCDAWQSASRDGVVVCPTCSARLLNAKYKDKLELDLG